MVQVPEGGLEWTSGGGEVEGCGAGGRGGETGMKCLGGGGMEVRGVGVAAG